MPGPERTLLFLENGTRLYATARGDQYWVVAADGSRTPCPATRACTLLLRERPASKPPPVPVPVEEGTECYTPWQRQLLSKLGLLADEIEPPDELGDLFESRSERDRR